jgi:hypothetical protein
MGLEKGKAISKDEFFKELKAELDAMKIENDTLRSASEQSENICLQYPLLYYHYQFVELYNIR